MSGFVGILAIAASATLQASMTPEIGDTAIPCANWSATTR
jgi:hypothetical protein